MPYAPIPTDTSPNGAPEALEALARGLRLGQDVLGMWYEAAYPGVLRLCRGFLGPAAAGTAEDVAQDAMLRLVDQIDRWDPARPYGGWERTVVLNVARNHLRAASRRSDHENAAATLDSMGSAGLPDPADAASAKEVGALVQRCLGLLSPREREAFVLVDLEGLAPKAAAEVMGVAASNVRAVLSLARRRLKEALAPHLAEGGLA